MDAAIQHYRWQADAIQFRASCRISRLYAANVHPASEWLPSKMPALAYWPQLETKARLESISEWDLFRAYEACPPSASDEELRSFLETKSIPQCALCPSRRVAFRHPSPLQRSNLQ